MLRSVLRPSLIVPLLLLTAPAGPSYAAEKQAYTPTTRDMMSINATLNRYLVGLDHHNAHSLASAFTEDAVFGLVDHGKKAPPAHGRAQIEAGWSRPPPPGAGVPPSMFHMISNDSWTFESPTRVRHFAYWLNVIPGQGQTTTLGASGHYEDVFVKQNGEWLIGERTIFVGTK